MNSDIIAYIAFIIVPPSWCWLNYQLMKEVSK